MVPFTAQNIRLARKSGFTLVELLVVISIIGVLATISTASFGTVRVKARDAKRVSDMQTFRNGIELYYAFFDTYPISSDQGLILGSPEAKSLSGAGFTPAGQEKEPIFIVNIPSNTQPGGIPYLYFSRNKDRSPCAQTCVNYDVAFALEEGVGDFKPGPHRLTETTLEGPEGNIKDFSAPTFLQQVTPTTQDVQLAAGAVQQTAIAAQQVAARPEVQTAGLVAAPVSFAAAFAGLTSALVAALPITSAGQVLFIFFSQPLLILSRRKRETWGTVYDSGKKTPVDLAVVRLIESRTGRSVATKVTDAGGRYAFTPPPGVYRIEVTKPGFTFPSTSLAGAHDDGRFTDIYSGTLVEVVGAGQTITLNIPLDPEGVPTFDPRTLAEVENRKRLKHALALSGPFIGFLVMLIRPNTITVLLFILHLFLYALFKRLAEPPKPKNQGIVYDEQTRDPIDHAVVRVLSLPYHKVLETRLTDASGRYHFYVGPGRYELVIVKPGYIKTETDPIDLSKADKPTFIAADLPLRAGPAAAPKKPDVTPAAK